MAELAYGVARTILEKLASKAYEEISLAKSVKKDLKKFEDMTLNVKSVLEDAEKKQRHNETLKRWLVRLKDVFDDAVDVLDEFECEALRRQVVAKHGSVGRKVRRFFSRSNPFAFRFSLSHQVKEIRERFDEIAKEMAQFNLISSHLNGREEQSHGLREMTHSFVNPSEIIGREGDKSMIIDMLMNQGADSTDSNVSVIPIVGLGGLGKTTLAKLVYNDEGVVAHFELTLWVCLPLDFNVTDSFRELLKAAITATNSRNTQNLSMDLVLARTKDVGNLSIDQMQMFLRSILMDKKVFLVLDDVWNEDVSKWSEVKGLLSTACAKGSKIIVTTRSTKVASVMGTSPPYKLEGLSKEDSFSLFRKYAFGDEQSSVEKFPKLKDIGKQIVEKCKGVPLALKSLGSLLNSNTDEREWSRIRDSEIWELEQENNDPILSALRLSYSTMPSYLKQCFAYCSLVPKNVRVERIDMIWKWMALGVVTLPNDNMHLEEVGKLYFRELCSRSFFQYLDDAEENFNITQQFEMHDLIYDLAISIIQNEHSTMNSTTTTVHESVKHLTILLNDGHSQISSMMLQNCKKLRSIYLIVQSDAEGNLDESLLSTCVSRFQHMRLLDFEGAAFEVLPSSIGKLKHLRYLNLCSNKKLKKLPNAICNLQSLQTLLLDECTELEFPKLKDIGKQIVEKCKGVPLALKSLGSLLNSNTDEREWSRIRDSEIWELEQENNDPILSALRLSYSTMPSYLKQCFAYCSLVPKNVRVERIDMIWKWMALGVVTLPNDNMHLEEVGKLYFRELCSRSFFQYLDDAEENFNITQQFEMHDLIYDLAISIIQNEHSTMNSTTTTVHESVKHLTILLNDGHSQISSMMLQNCKKLRSIYLIVQSDAEGNLDESLLSTCVSRFQHMRLLDFEGAAFEVLPSSIGKLKHLRYLNLCSNKKLKKLPNAICNLQSLQTLLLDECTELEELPRDIRNMVSLTTLAVTTKQAYFQEDGIGRLKSLRRLLVHQCKNLRALPHDMRHCTSLRTLSLFGCEQLELASSPDQPDEALSLNMSLQTLVIAELPKTTALPYWVKAAANTLQQLFVADCQELAALPDWLPDLTALLTLVLGKCPKLSSFPEGTQRLMSLTQLLINECGSLEERCRREAGEDWPMIAHIPNISIC